MFNWLLQKSRDARYGNQITQTLWLIEAQEFLDRAHALIWVGVCREQITKDSWKYSSAFHWPEQIPKDELVELYAPIEALRITQQRQCEQTLKEPMFVQIMGADAEKHMLAGLHGWQVVLATMAAGLAPNSNNEVRLMWQGLHQSHKYLPAAMDRFRNSLKKMGAHDFPFSDAECIDNARVIPERLAEHFR